MRYPKFLQEQGTIGFIAPSFGCAAEPYKSAFAHAQEVFRDKGHKLKLGPNSMADAGVGISNTPDLCGKEFMEYYCSGQNDCLISCGGGELMCEVLDYIDFEKLALAEPKWFMGYSDNTNLTFLLATICDTASIYGPCAGAFGMEPWHESIQDAYDVLCGKKKIVTGYTHYERESKKDEEHPLAPYNVTEASSIAAMNVEGGKAEFAGRLIGGCMDCLVNLTGTKYDHVAEFADKYKDEGILWFLEACDLNVMAMRRAMWQMEHAGWFRHVRGFLIGRPLCHGEEMMGMDQYKAVYDVVRHYDVPVLMDLDIGHVAPMMPLICGSYAKVCYEGAKLSVQMS